jgi:dephospho-CoA kinase
VFVLGVTGGIGCGKSTVAGICHAAGLPLIDADQLSRAVTGPGGAAIADLKVIFGDGAITEEGGLDRKKMAGLVFSDKRLLDQLSATVHRFVILEMGEQVQRLDEAGQRAVVLDVPIPVKRGFLDICDQVWVVWADDEIRLERLAARGMDREEARRRMAMQMSREQYTDLADFVLENNGSLAELEEKVAQLLDQELGQRGIRLRR